MGEVIQLDEYRRNKLPEFRDIRRVFTDLGLGSLLLTDAAIAQIRAAAKFGADRVLGHDL